MWACSEPLLPNVTDYLHIIAPLVVLLVVLLGLHAVRETVNPLFAGIVAGLAKHAQINAPAYGMAILFGLSASLSAFWDVFHSMTKQQFYDMSWHAYMANWCKVLNPFIVAALAYCTKPKEVA